MCSLIPGHLLLHSLGSFLRLFFCVRDCLDQKLSGLRAGALDVPGFRGGGGGTDLAAGTNRSAAGPIDSTPRDALVVKSPSNYLEDRPVLAQRPDIQDSEFDDFSRAIRCRFGKLTRGSSERPEGREKTWRRALGLGGAHICHKIVPKAPVRRCVLGCPCALRAPKPFRIQFAVSESRQTACYCLSDISGLVTSGVTTG